MSDTTDLVQRAHNAGFVEASRIHGQEIERLRAERNALKAALEDALCIFAFGDDDKTVLAPKWVARAKAAIAKAQDRTP